MKCMWWADAPELERFVNQALDVETLTRIAMMDLPRCGKGRKGEM